MCRGGVGVEGTWGVGWGVGGVGGGRRDGEGGKGRETRGGGGGTRLPTVALSSADTGVEASVAPPPVERHGGRGWCVMDDVWRG
jgi:hypothetical protein